MGLEPTFPPTLRIRQTPADFSHLSSAGLVISAVLTSVGLAYVLVNFSPTLALLGILAVPIGILLVTRPDLGLLLVVFAIPLEDFNKIGNSGLSVLKLLSIAVFGGAVIHFLVFRRKDRLVYAPQNWLVSLFLCMAILSNFVAIAPQVTLNNIFRLLRILSLYLIVINIVQTETDLKRLMWAFLISGFLCALYGIYNYYFAPSLLDEGRATGTMNNANAFAAAMVARLPLALCLSRVEKSGWKKLFLVVGAGILLHGITLSGSRGGLLALGLSLLLLILFQKKRVAWTIIGGLVVFALLVAMPLNLKQRVGLAPSTALGPENSVSRRITYQVHGMQILRQHPLLGVGFGGFSESYARSEYRFLQRTSVGRVAHNTYLEIATGTGLLGAIPFISLLALSLFVAWKAARDKQQPYLANASVGLFTGMGGYFLASAFLSQQYKKTLWLLIAMVVVVWHLANVANRRMTPYGAIGHQAISLGALSRSVLRRLRR